MMMVQLIVLTSKCFYEAPHYIEHCDWMEKNSINVNSESNLKKKKDREKTLYESSSGCQS